MENIGTNLIFQENLPLQDYFIIIDDHYSLRQTMVEIQTELDQSAYQFRAIQKRLLSRFKVFYSKN